MSEEKFDVETGLNNLAPLAAELGLELDELGNLLMLYPVNGSLDGGISTDVYLGEVGEAIRKQVDEGADPADIDGADKLFKIAAALAIDDYFREVAAHTGDYMTKIKKNLDEVTRDKKPGESLNDCVKRNLQKYNLIVSLTPALPEQNIFSQDFTPILNNIASNELAGLDMKSFKKNNLTQTATYTSPKGTKFTIKNFDKLTGNLSTSAKKIFYAALLELTTTNIHRTPVRRATVEIPLIEYGEANGKRLHADTMPTEAEQATENARVEQRIKDFKKQVRKDLNTIKSIEISREETRGYIRGDYRDMNLISSHAIRTGPGGPVIEINFDVKAAQYFNNSYVSWFPTALFKADNRNPNEFSIGCKIALQNSIDNNVAKGTDNTLTVRALLEAAPDIVSNLDELKADRGRYDWKLQIKTPLERSLNGLIDIGYLEKWIYRNSKTGKTYTPSEAARLSWNTYYNLCVDFIILPDNPGRENRTRDRLEAKNAAKNAEEG